MTTLAALVTLLQSEVPAVDSVPTSDQYTQAVKDAVMEFSRQCGLTKIATLSIVSGTATYSLPADFIRLIELADLTGPEGVMSVSGGGLIAVSTDWEEEYTIINKQITFYPTPAYSLTRYYKYKTGWIAISADYTTMGDDEARIVILKAKAIAFGKQANAQAGDSIKYSFGAVSEDLSGGAESTRKDADASEKEFLEACRTYNGQVAFLG